jgi:hypothetical protein
MSSPLANIFGLPETIGVMCPTFAPSHFGLDQLSIAFPSQGKHSSGTSVETFCTNTVFQTSIRSFSDGLSPAAIKFFTLSSDGSVVVSSFFQEHLNKPYGATMRILVNACILAPWRSIFSEDEKLYLLELRSALLKKFLLLLNEHISLASQNGFFSLNFNSKAFWIHISDPTFWPPETWPEIKSERSLADFFRDVGNQNVICSHRYPYAIEEETFTGVRDIFIDVSAPTENFYSHIGKDEKGFFVRNQPVENSDVYPEFGIYDKNFSHELILIPQSTLIVPSSDSFVVTAHHDHRGRQELGHYRAHAKSRRPFSDTALASSLSRMDVSYTHEAVVITSKKGLKIELISVKTLTKDTTFDKLSIAQDVFTHSSDQVPRTYKQCTVLQYLVWCIMTAHLRDHPMSPYGFMSQVPCPPRLEYLLNGSDNYRKFPILRVSEVNREIGKEMNSLRRILFSCLALDATSLFLSAMRIPEVYNKFHITDAASIAVYADSIVRSLSLANPIMEVSNLLPLFACPSGISAYRESTSILRYIKLTVISPMDPGAPLVLRGGMSYNKEKSISTATHSVSKMFLRGDRYRYDFFDILTFDGKTAPKVRPTPEKFVLDEFLKEGVATLDFLKVAAFFTGAKVESSYGQVTIFDHETPIVIDVSLKMTTGSFRCFIGHMVEYDPSFPVLFCEREIDTKGQPNGLGEFLIPADEVFFESHEYEEKNDDDDFASEDPNDDVESEISNDPDVLSVDIPDSQAIELKERDFAPLPKPKQIKWKPKDSKKSSKGKGQSVNKTNSKPSKHKKNGRAPRKSSYGIASAQNFSSMYGKEASLIQDPGLSSGHNELSDEALAENIDLLKRNKRRRKKGRW